MWLRAVLAFLVPLLAEPGAAGVVVVPVGGYGPHPAGPLVRAADSTALAADFIAAERQGTLDAWTTFLDRYGATNDSALVGLAVRRRDALVAEAEAEVRRRTATHDPWLMPASGRRAPPLELTRDERGLVQTALGYLGYYAGQADGVFGPETMAAVSKARTAAGLEPGHAIDFALLRVLPDVPAIDGLKSHRARSFRNVALPENMEPRLAHALAAMGHRPVVFGYFRGSLYVAGIGSEFERGWTNLAGLSYATGGHLVTITNAAENAFVHALFSRDPRFLSKDPDGHLRGPLIGLFQTEGSAEPSGGWAWVTGEPFDYANWSPGAPDNAGGAERFASFARSADPPGGDPRAIYWDDVAGHGRSFVLEIE